MPAVATRTAPLLSANLPSPIPEADDAAWMAFVRAMATHPAGAESPSGSLGMFQIKPRRLAELGLMADAAPAREGRAIRCSGTFEAPVTRDRFLADPAVQYATFVASIRDYADRLRRGDLVRPESMTFAAALAVLHRAGRGGIEGHSLLPDTFALMARAKDLF